MRAIYILLVLAMMAGGILFAVPIFISWRFEYSPTLIERSAAFAVEEDPPGCADMSWRFVTPFR